MPNLPDHPSERSATGAMGQTVAGFEIRDAPDAAHYVSVFQGLTTVRSAPIEATPLVLGRDPSRAFYLPDVSVSRAHCELRLVEGAVLVRDLDSTNGTFIDGQRVVGERVLPLASVLQLGGHLLRHELLTPAEVKREQQLTHDLDRARRYLLALLPDRVLDGPLRLDWRFVPCSVLGGDALGYHELGGGRLALYVVDVCGHGIGPAMHSASVLNVVRGRTLLDSDAADPAEVLRRLNDAFAMEAHNGMYFSIWYGVLDPASGRLTYSSAGHPPALLRGLDGSIRTRLARKHPPIGTLAGRRFDQAQVTLAPGERLYIFSDGVYELTGRDGHEYGLEHFERALVEGPPRRSERDTERLYDIALSHAGRDLLEDDFTLLVVSYG